jgi:hypothetical protein
LQGSAEDIRQWMRNTVVSPTDLKTAVAMLDELICQIPPLAAKQERMLSFLQDEVGSNEQYQSHLDRLNANLKAMDLEEIGIYDRNKCN